MIAFSHKFRPILLVGLIVFSLIASSCNESRIELGQISPKKLDVMTASENSRADIESAIFDKYLLGQKMKSADIISDAFHPESVMIYSGRDSEGNGRFQRWLNMHETAVEWAEQSSTDLDLTQFEILSMNIVDNRMAMVVLKVQDRVFDGITLVKDGDEWKIASKVYIAQEN